ncbi:hypothetical protein EDL98_06935 [Ornithobacterium rhinotracheale]|uniref:hypothetical protein n=1 Tax=Ornithobacterium rhinotracheale TaxID=28251 RepID=UPI00129CFAAE|nr:hypothetical protein [Ornithobacterium rhinotracheale]MRJ07546.1 hypothetical protein [Ornithobacterium rhinotracheale]MRJ10817.1 hypothetical protein [Ornithobacterium rhinotracheale]UOH78142.1 hypothetical protein MT996_01415 [Ornithobacterium rhinotracheale]
MKSKVFLFLSFFFLFWSCEENFVDNEFVRIEGRVVNPENQAMKQLILKFKAFDGITIAKAITNSEGHFEAMVPRTNGISWTKDTSGPEIVIDGYDFLVKSKEGSKAFPLSSLNVEYSEIKNFYYNLGVIFVQKHKENEN